MLHPAQASPSANATNLADPCAIGQRPASLNPGSPGPGFLRGAPNTKLCGFSSRALSTRSSARVSHQQREILGAGPQMLRQLAYRRNHVQARVKNRRAQADARGLPARGLEQLARGTIVVQGHVSKPGDALVTELGV